MRDLYTVVTVMSVVGERKKTPKGSLKEKVLQVYDKLFQGQDITQGRAEFWDDFFLLKVNVSLLLSLMFSPISNVCLHTLRKQVQKISLD